MNTEDRIKEIEEEINYPTCGVTNEDAAWLIAALRSREKALREIAAQDYRGNRSPESIIAKDEIEKEIQ